MVRGPCCPPHQITKILSIILIPLCFDLFIVCFLSDMFCIAVN